MQFLLTVFYTDHRIMHHVFGCLFVMVTHKRS